MNFKILLLLIVFFCSIGKAQKHNENELDIRYDVLKKLYPGESIYEEETLKNLFIVDEKSKLILDEIKQYDAKFLFPNSNYCSTNGIIGDNYQRIQIFITKVEKSKENPLQYNVQGKSKVKDNICNFSGSLIIINTGPNDPEFFAGPTAGHVVAAYKFYEDSTNISSGYFEGNYYCDYYLDKRRKLMILDFSEGELHGYWNNTYIGAWTSYKTGKSKKCIWGDGEFPYTPGFNEGTCEVIVSDKYVKNGWESFNDFSEWEEINGIWQEKDKWWLK